MSVCPQGDRGCYDVTYCLTAPTTIGQHPSPPPRSQQADGTHPIGMLLFLRKFSNGFDIDYHLPLKFKATDSAGVIIKGFSLVLQYWHAHRTGHFLPILASTIKHKTWTDRSIERSATTWRNLTLSFLMSLEELIWTCVIKLMQKHECTPFAQSKSNFDTLVYILRWFNKVPPSEYLLQLLCMLYPRVHSARLQCKSVNF